MPQTNFCIWCLQDHAPRVEAAGTISGYFYLHPECDTTYREWVQNMESGRGSTQPQELLIKHAGATVEIIWNRTGWTWQLVDGPNWRSTSEYPETWSLIFQGLDAWWKSYRMSFGPLEFLQKMGIYERT